MMSLHKTEGNSTVLPKSDAILFVLKEIVTHHQQFLWGYSPGLLRLLHLFFGQTPQILNSHFRCVPKENLNSKITKSL